MNYYSLPHSPSYATVTFFFCTQASRSIEHLLPYVLSSVPHTGAYISAQAMSHEPANGHWSFHEMFNSCSLHLSPSLYHPTLAPPPHPWSWFLTQSELIHPAIILYSLATEIIKGEMFLQVRTILIKITPIVFNIQCKCPVSNFPEFPVCQITWFCHRSDGVFHKLCKPTESVV